MIRSIRKNDVPESGYIDFYLDRDSPASNTCYQLPKNQTKKKNKNKKKKNNININIKKNSFFLFPINSGYSQAFPQIYPQTFPQEVKLPDHLFSRLQ